MRGYLATFVVLAGLVGVGYWYLKSPRGPRVTYRTSEITRGDVQSVVSATGTIEPEDLVDVGVQVAGRVHELGRDPGDPMKSVDYGTRVAEGTVLAKIDDAMYESQVQQARAAVQRARADAEQQRIKLEQMEREWNRAQNFRKTLSISEADADLAKANWQMAQATVGVAEAGLEQAKASLHQAEINLGYTTIRSPVNGVIIDRRVNVGQTVVASFNAPSLFLIAKDLRRLQVWASVNEADIGQIHPGQPVKFTVDAQAGEVFRGVVAQIRLNATMTQNVVTYTVVVSTDNPDGKLLPYLTANLQFERATQSDVLLAPNIALRWQPRRTEGGKGAGGTKFDSGGGKKPKGPGDPTLGKVWVRDGDGVRPIDVTVGLTDGVVSEVSGDGIVEGLELIVGDVVNETGGQTSPFAPKMTPGGTPTGGSGGGRGGGGKTP